MEKVKICCFTVNYTHSSIIANNFITNELSDVKVVYMNEKSEKRKTKNIINKFYKSMQNKTFFTECLNENVINDYEKEKFVFVVNGKKEYIDRVNNYLDANDFNGYIINAYDVFEKSLNIDEIISKHDYYINTTGLIKREESNLA